MVSVRRECRVGPGNFTPSPSQIRTGISRFIRLVPSREGCRLLLNEGLIRANPLAHISSDDPPPSLYDHHSRFNTTTEQSVPLRCIGTFSLAIIAACAFSFAITGQVLPILLKTGHTGARSRFALPTRAASRSVRIRTPPELVSQVGSTRDFDIT